MIKSIKLPVLLRSICLAVLFVFLQSGAYAGDKDFPDRPNPPRLVNDLANTMTPDQQAQLEAKLDAFAKATSNQIVIVTIKSLGEYDISDYATELGNKWGVGTSANNNGVVVLASMDDHKINISTGRGLEGALPDAICGRIINNEMKPAFKQGDYYTGFSKAADAIIAATKGEYKGGTDDGNGHFPVLAVILIVIFLVWVIFRMRGGGGSGGGSYMSGRGFAPFATGWLLGSGFGGGFGGGGEGGGGGGGFGGFGGGGFGGGGASGGW